MSATDKVDYILRAKEAGFFIRLFFVSTESPTINAKRVAQRVLDGGHDVPIPKIISRYDKSIANCIALAPYVDKLYVYDNSIEDAEARLLFRLSDGNLAKRYIEELPTGPRVYCQDRNIFNISLSNSTIRGMVNKKRTDSSDR